MYGKVRVKNALATMAMGEGGACKTMTNKCLKTHDGNSSVLNTYMLIRPVPAVGRDGVKSGQV